jgi:hypothetical protein
VEPPKRTTGFGHNSITIVILNDGDGTLLRKEITIKIFQNGVFHITGVLDEKYDRSVTRILREHICANCPTALVSGEWVSDNRRVVLMNYKTNYEPAVYPAVKIYFPDVKWIAKVFRTGQIILTGMTTQEECNLLMEQLRPLIASIPSS